MKYEPWERQLKETLQFLMERFKKMAEGERKRREAGMCNEQLGSTPLLLFSS